MTVRIGSIYLVKEAFSEISKSLLGRMLWVWMVFLSREWSLFQLYTLI